MANGERFPAFHGVGTRAGGQELCAAERPKDAFARERIEEAGRVADQRVPVAGRLADAP